MKLSAFSFISHVIVITLLQLIKVRNIFIMLKSPDMSWTVGFSSRFMHLNSGAYYVDIYIEGG